MTKIEDEFQLIPEDRVMVFVDGQSVYSACRQLDFTIDYAKLKSHFHFNCRYVRGIFYTPVLPDNPDRHDPARTMIDYLEYNDWTITRKPIKEFSDDEGRRAEKSSSVGVEIATDMMKAAFTNRIDHMILFSGDGAYVPLVKEIKGLGIKVTVVSTLGGGAPASSMIADELRRQADTFVDLKNLTADFSRRMK
jgi:uncharacterized LabA/DUF88 family protein